MAGPPCASESRFRLVNWLTASMTPPSYSGQVPSAAAPGGTISQLNRGELSQLVDLLQRHCLLGQVHYRMWRRLNESFRDRPEVGNLTPTFFILAAEAHLNSTLLILNRFIDKRRDTLSIWRFLVAARASADKFPNSTPGAVSKAVEEDLLRLDAVASTVDNVRSHRNQQFLHLSKALLAPPFGVVPAEQSFQYGDIYLLLELIGCILNRYGILLRGNELAMAFMDEQEDFEYLMALLTRCVDGIGDS